jgi:endonuclease-8
VAEGDTVHRAARALQALAGERVSVRAFHPRARAAGVAERVDGRRLLAVDAHGKNLLLRFDGGVMLCSHLGMSGSWRLQPQSEPVRGSPWLVLEGGEQRAVLRGGAVLTLGARSVSRLGLDILADPPDLGAIAARLRGQPERAIGDALLDQRLVAGIGNIWRNEALWRARVSPWARVVDLSDEELSCVLEHAATLMRRSLDSGRVERTVYRRTGRPCPRCGTTIAARGQGEAARTAYWCPRCQPDPERG